jgi:23S rRNA (guanosine2251-2'-O)-methyltransferase
MRNKSEESVRNAEDVMIFGIRAVMEAVDSGKEIERIFIQRDLNNPLAKELKDLLRRRNISFVLVPQEKLNRLSRKNHQGVIGFISHVNYLLVEELVPTLFEKGKIPVLLLLDRITDVRNFGAICRSAECNGVDAVIIPERGGAMVTGDAVKASAGSLNRINVCREKNLKEVLDYLHDSGFMIIGCSEKGDSYIFNHKIDAPVCVIMGSEEDGISQEYTRRCDKLLKIPIIGKTASLNVSVATGIILYEITRQHLKQE